VNYRRDPSVSEWDSAHFGVRIATFGPTEERGVTHAVSWAQANEIALLMARCPASRTDLTLSLAKEGFTMMDTFVRYKLDLLAHPEIQAKPGGAAREACQADASEISQLAGEVFANYIGHFHNDPRLPGDTCTDLYAQWARNAFTDTKLARAVLIGVDNARSSWFALLKDHGDGIGEIVLGGVAPEARGQGYYSTLMLHCLMWFQAHNFAIVEIDTQLPNLGIQRVWQRLGFEIFYAGHTFHKWLPV